jgi:hypothetical protein
VGELDTVTLVVDTSIPPDADRLMDDDITADDVIIGISIIAHKSMLYVTCEEVPVSPYELVQSI